MQLWVGPWDRAKGMHISLQKSSELLFFVACLLVLVYWGWIWPASLPQDTHGRDLCDGWPLSICGNNGIKTRQRTWDMGHMEEIWKSCPRGTQRQRGHTNPHNFCSPYPLHEHWVGICRTEMTVYRIKDILKTYSDDSDSKHWEGTRLQMKLKKSQNQYKLSSK